MKLIHQRINGRLPFIGVGKLYTADDIAQAWETGWAEFIALGKTVMLNPDLIELIPLHARDTRRHAAGDGLLSAAKAIHRAGMAVIIANPRQTHQFAQSQSLTKTDAKDAKILAFFAQMTARKKVGKPCSTTRPPKRKKCWKHWLTAATNWWICGLPRKTVCIRFTKRKSKASNN